MSQEPDPAECQGPSDVGKWEYDSENNVYYECCYEERKDLYVWVIVPPVDS